MVSRWRRSTAVEISSAISAVSLSPCFNVVQRGIAQLLAGGVLFFACPARTTAKCGHRDPSSSSRCASPLQLEFVEQGARTSASRLAFEMEEADDHVGDLDAGVVDVVLHVDFLAGGAEQADECVAEDGVAQVADVRGLVGIDAGVLDQCMERLSGRSRAASGAGDHAARRRHDRGGH